MFDSTSTTHQVGASLLVTATNTTSSNSSSKYVRFWRRSLVIRVLIISLRRASKNQEETASRPYLPLPATTDVSCEQLSRTQSARSHFAVDIPSDSEVEGVEYEQPSLRHTLRQIVKERDFCALQKFGGVERAASVFGSDLRRGRDEGRRDLHMWNTTQPVRSYGFFKYFVESCNNYTVPLLLISAGLSFGVEMVEQGTKDGWHDGVGILFALLLLIIFPAISNYRRARKLEKKQQKRQRELEVEVVRGGVSEQINVSNIVEGDLVKLTKGNIVPADGLFVDGDGLVLDEASNSKISQRTNPFLCSGSKVMNGYGSMLVILEGPDTETGKAMGLANPDPKGMTFLEAQIDKPNSYIDNLTVTVTVLIALVLLISLLVKRSKKNDDVLPELKGNVSTHKLMKVFESIFLRPRGRIHVLTSTLVAVVLGIQHGMPFVITVSMSYWNEKMELYQVKPQNLSACGSMSLITVICINASGGLFCNEMEVENFFVGGEDIKTDEHSRISEVVLDALRLGIGVLPDIPVSPTNDLLISWAKSNWGEVMEFSEQYSSVIDCRRLKHDRSCSQVLMRTNDKEEKILHLHLTGAASTILSLCSHYYDTGGELQAIDDSRRKFEQMIEDMENSDLRAIAFASKQTEIPEVTEDGFQLITIVGLKYSCLEEAKLAIADLRSAGVSIKLLSQDEPSVVRAIAHELGVIQPGSDYLELEAEQIRDLIAVGRMEKVEQVILMGNCLSEDKLLMVQSLKQKGHIVAFFGGTTASDIPALKEADLGITEDTCSTEMARQNCDIIISNAKALCIVLKYGRYAFHNIRNFTRLQLSACISGSLINLVAAIGLWDSPLTTIQLLWVSIITCLQGGLMMVMESSQEIITNPLPDRSQSLITSITWRSIAVEVVYQVSVVVILHVLLNEHVWKSLVFNSFVLCQVFNLLKTMDLLNKQVIKALLNRYWFLASLLAVIVLQALLVELARDLFDSVRLTALHWISSLAIAILPLVSHLSLKFISGYLSDWLLAHTLLGIRLFHFFTTNIMSD